MKKLQYPLALLVISIMGCSSYPIVIPTEGRLYHAVFPGSATGAEDGVTPEDLRSYEQNAGKTVAWVYFSHNWFRGRSFPAAEVAWIKGLGSIPFIRLMLRSDLLPRHAETTYSLDRIIAGEFDNDFHTWFAAAGASGTPLYVEYGSEANADWFSWNGTWNGGGDTDGFGDIHVSDGPERFREAYRHIIRICREEDARNVSWVFHVNWRDEPAEPWNRLEEYYPGDDWIDAIAVSIYGAQQPTDPGWPQLREFMDQAYPRLVALSPVKPMMLMEFGATSGNPNGDQAAWARDALEDILSGRWPRLIAFSWWNGAWMNDGNPVHNSRMRIQDNPDLARVFHELLSHSQEVIGRRAP